MLLNISLSVLLKKKDSYSGSAVKGAESQLYKIIVTKIEPGDSDYNPEHSNGTRSEDIAIGAFAATYEKGNLIFTNLDWDNYFVKEVKRRSFLSF